MIMKHEVKEVPFAEGSLLGIRTEDGKVCDEGFDSWEGFKPVFRKAFNVPDTEKI